MADAQEKTVRLQVGNARPNDVGKGAARLDHNAFQELGLQKGAIVEIGGKRRTAAIALPPYEEDEGLRLIRLDGLQRANAGVGGGDVVEVRTAEVRPAKRIVVAPAQRISASAAPISKTSFAARDCSRCVQVSKRMKFPWRSFRMP